MSNKKGFTFIEFMIVFLIIVLLFSMAQPNKRNQSRMNKYEKACFSNQRLIGGASEMYNMDHSEMVENLIPGRDYEEFEKKLINEGYLKEPCISPFEKCSYGLKEYNVFCKCHGRYDDSSNIPEYDKSLEIPFSSEYEDIRRSFYEKIDKAEELEQIKGKILDFIFSPKLITILIMLLIFINIVITFLKYKEGRA